MIFRDAKRLSLLVAPVLLLIYLTYSVYHSPLALAQDQILGEHGSPPQQQNQNQEHLSKPDSNHDTDSSNSEESKTDTDTLKGVPIFPNGAQTDIPPPKQNEESGIALGHVEEELVAPETHKEIFSQSTLNKQFFYIDMDGATILNPNLIPHPTENERWIVVAQLKNADHISVDSFEIECTASFRDLAMRCDGAPKVLPIKPTRGDKCTGKWEINNLNSGPHDARVFMGPDSPFVVYGSNSQFICFGQFVQSFQSLGDWDSQPKQPLFETGTEMQRPEPSRNQVEKNWFLFWDAEGNMYTHYDAYPNRGFSRLYSDGTTGPDLALLSAESDGKCLDKYIPKLATENEWIHQATNSLLLTMCRRSDQTCVRSEENTFVVTIIQKKVLQGLRSVYEPYVMVFNQRAPFAIHGISKRPLWIHGRKPRLDQSTTDMFYVTSMGWKSQGQKNHGYLDDHLFLAFGIEDEMGGAIDIVANDLVDDLGLCYEA
ncbi:unnamed protein product [Clonostachys byssicola]|uniref:Uncharacterized protein n=1 Tax=Clonostachys byssicola TaxID=160290 RepID=A0A9N9TZ56_9HYPO|nr:unnamed protein product [Clonostachys byssicola]